MAKLGKRELLQRFLSNRQDVLLMRERIEAVMSKC